MLCMLKYAMQVGINELREVVYLWTIKLTKALIWPRVVYCIKLHCTALHCTVLYQIVLLDGRICSLELWNITLGSWLNITPGTQSKIIFLNLILNRNKLQNGAMLPFFCG